jgi:AcrR family transcriptional regulator
VPTSRAALIPASDGAVSADGRLARGERTRLRVAEALISLLEEGDPRPTAKAVATRAGVSLRLVFHHFEDMDAVYRAVITLQARRHWDRLRPVPPSLPLHQRIERTVRRRAGLFDAVSPVRRVSVSLAVRSADVAASLAETGELLRRLLTVTFAAELETAGQGTAGVLDALDAADLLDALDAAASWEAWERLRRVQRLSNAAAPRGVTRTMSALLGLPPDQATPVPAQMVGPDGSGRSDGLEEPNR